MARRWGVTDEELLAWAQCETSPLFSEVDRLVLMDAEGVSRTPVNVAVDLVKRLREQFNDAQIVEAAGSSQGRVCALPPRSRGQALHRSGNAPAGLAQDPWS